MRGGKEKKDSPMNGLADVRKQRHKHSETGDRNQSMNASPIFSKHLIMTCLMMTLSR